MNELYHHGIKGQKWGVRRYQNSDGSLTPAGKKRISKKYKKASMAGDRDLLKNYNRLTINAYNKTADKMNNGGINEFNKAQEKKYGKEFAKRVGYENDYMSMFNKELNSIMKKEVLDFIASNKNYQKADAMVSKYSMLEWDALAKSNQDGMEAIRKALRN